MHKRQLQITARVNTTEQQPKPTVSFEIVISVRCRLNSIYIIKRRYIYVRNIILNDHQMPQLMQTANAANAIRLIVFLCFGLPNGVGYFSI